MSILEDVVVNAKSAVNVVGKKAGQIVDVSKLKINAADLNNEINRRFMALGKLAYEEKKKNVDSAAQQEEVVAAIEELYEQLDAVNDQLLQLRDKALCKNCGAENPGDAVFCNQCGKKLEE